MDESRASERRYRLRAQKKNPILPAYAPKCVQALGVESGEMMDNQQKHAAPRKATGLYDPSFEHDACGVGYVVNIDGDQSHAIIEKGLAILENLSHRGATGADENTGDGAGILVQVPDAYLREECKGLKIKLPKAGSYGVGMFFLPQDDTQRKTCMDIAEAVIEEEAATFLGWREVPTDGSVLGARAREEQPVIMQAFATIEGVTQDVLERKLYVIRKQIEKRALPVVDDNREAFYVPSFSSRTVVYKGLMMASQVMPFYGDLQAPAMVSALAVVHQRYSTNTFPSWSLAQPFRYLAHNGEINTLRGNLRWMRSRERNFESSLFKDDIKKIVPVIEKGGSDSACLDNAFELLERGGRSPWHAMMMLVPQAWGESYPMGPDLRGFFEYHAGLIEPWDGPAAITFTDGVHVGAMLDRNGLRPGRYAVTKSREMVFASEAGVLDLKPEEIEECGALRPGQMIFVDTEERRIVRDYEIKMRLARRHPYRRWVEENQVAIHGFFNAVSPLAPDHDQLLTQQRLFGYTREDQRRILDVMASEAHEPIGSMGADQPLAVLSEKPQILYWYFKQLFAQVTNPAIDPIREQLVMSLMTFLGSPDQILMEVPQHAQLVKLRHPILSNEDLVRIRELSDDRFSSRTLNIGFPVDGGGAALETALEKLCDRAASVVHAGYRNVILSDRDLPKGEAPIPAVLAVSAVNQTLIEKQLRTSSSLIVETGEAREVMHFAVLLGYGASAINPYIAFDTVADMVIRKQLSESIGVAKAIENYVTAACKGLLKTMSKNGISTLRSYRSSQTFQIIGISKRVVDKYFEGTTSQIEGIGLDEIAAETKARYDDAYQRKPGASSLLSPGGHYQHATGGERHLWTPDSIRLLQSATRTNDSDLYRQYAALINDQGTHLSTLRGMFRFKACTPIPIEEVEPASEIVKRFVTGAMSFGSISREAHETLAIAMNRLGGMSNSGEGGEDPARFVPLPNGDSRNSAIKQIASGRFGVTAEYLVNARDLQIKISQGAKPGEGGQLPGHKVNEEIGRVRHSTPGVTLISPPPHHDIYSIEDIAQLIYDLKNANRDARVSVKLVSEAGVGTVAAGVAKGHADMILIAGYDGGTGASPLSSIKHAGGPWELGLAEAHQTLLLNGLRNRVRLQVDGQLKTGRDVVVGALLGAEEFGFATAPLVVCGCVMMRKCHTNGCPVGVATQDPELRKRYTGKPEHVVNFLTMIAEEARGIMASLGIRTIDELVGRSDLIEVNDAITFWKARGLDFSKVLMTPDAKPEDRRCTQQQEHGWETGLDNTYLEAACAAMDAGKPFVVESKIRNVNRTVGTLVSSELAKRFGNAGLADDTITLKYSGAAGQSFGAFASKGMTMVLEGEGNDYVGKGLSGGKIILKPYAGADYDPAENMVAGNVVLYGATGGEAYLNGQAGERFAIRNSGATVVVEGVGDHGCEYMTGGCAVILGSTGVNFGAGMSGGIAYIYDETGNFDNQCNLDTLDLEQLKLEADLNHLKQLLENHVRYTGSPKARKIVENWDLSIPRFIKVFPMEYKRALGKLSCEDEAIQRGEPLQQ
jgi:glutamate synthase domain-containing protein 2/glutamate synthase domain-containing protein 1/glutamate synthase domain-containing protein 3